MPSATRRRSFTTPSNAAPSPSPPSPSSKRDSVSIRSACIFFTLITASLIFVAHVVRSNQASKISVKSLLLDAQCDDEDTLSTLRIRPEDYVHPQFRVRGVACMPSVTRWLDGERVEYVSNAVKSWRLATNRSLELRQLTVFDMDAIPAKRPFWLDNVFESTVTELPSWLRLATREHELIAPRKLTLGDDEERVKWRSKEALDYAEVLRRCTEQSDAEYIIIVQDDVLFRFQMNKVVSWCDQHLQDSFTVNEQGRPKHIRKCSASLFDLSAEEEDAHELRSSNMVARVWRRDVVQSMVRYLTTNFDEAPVDWLADRRCRNQRRRNVVMEPNPVRHRGRVSSFPANEREATIT
ncbi:N-Acetylglucosaminyltransferase-IV (GnT-IV) [Gracilaria domingensis]|nr:N-Acetylglucosaminyltransferase-IV (GnT-IV) [Gracilaria domingensis]